jgi:hypothetical protein
MRIFLVLALGFTTSAAFAPGAARAQIGKQSFCVCKVQRSNSFF